jgi:hypothetical protein
MEVEKRIGLSVGGTVKKVFYLILRDNGRDGFSHSLFISPTPIKAVKIHTKILIGGSDHASISVVDDAVKPHVLAAGSTDIVTGETVQITPTHNEKEPSKIYWKHTGGNKSGIFNPKVPGHLSVESISLENISAFAESGELLDLVLCFDSRVKNQSLQFTIATMPIGYEKAQEYHWNHWFESWGLLFDQPIAGCWVAAGIQRFYRLEEFENGRRVRSVWENGKIIDPPQPLSDFSA